MFKKSYEKRCANRADKHIPSTYELITDIEGGECPINYKCHRNSKHRNIKDKQKIVSCYAWDGTQYISHFINKKGSKYIENTTGCTGIYTKYYLVKEYKENEFSDPDEELLSLKQTYLNYGSIPFLNRLFNVEAIN